MSWFDTGFDECLHQDPADDPYPIEDDDVELDDLEEDEKFDEDDNNK